MWWKEPAVGTPSLGEHCADAGCVAAIAAEASMMPECQAHPTFLAMGPAIEQAQAKCKAKGF